MFIDFSSYFICSIHQLDDKFAKMCLHHPSMFLILKHFMRCIKVCISNLFGHFGIDFTCSNFLIHKKSLTSLTFILLKLQRLYMSLSRKQPNSWSIWRPTKTTRMPNTNCNLLSCRLRSLLSTLRTVCQVAGYSMFLASVYKYPLPSHHCQFSCFHAYCYLMLLVYWHHQQVTIFSDINLFLLLCPINQTTTTLEYGNMSFL